MKHGDNASMPLKTVKNCTSWIRKKFSEKYTSKLLAKCKLLAIKFLVKNYIQAANKFNVFCLRYDNSDKTD